VEHVLKAKEGKSEAKNYAETGKIKMVCVCMCVTVFFRLFDRFEAN